MIFSPLPFTEENYLAHFLIPLLLRVPKPLNYCLCATNILVKVRAKMLPKILWVILLLNVVFLEDPKVSNSHPCLKFNGATSFSNKLAQKSVNK